MNNKSNSTTADVCGNKSNDNKNYKNINNNNNDIHHNNNSNL